MKKIVQATIVTLGMVLTVGCAPKGVSQSTLNQSMVVKPGIVTAVKMVAINNNGVGNGLGAVLGTAAGAAAGSNVGGGNGRIIATAAGAVVGGAIGGTIGNNMDNRQGVEVVVKLNNGQTIATVLESNGALSALQAGQAVNVIYSGSKIVNISPR